MIDRRKLPVIAWLTCALGVFGLVKSQTESPNENVATGKLNQFKGFYTPRPFPSNAQFRTYSSVWASWSAWSFCANNVQIRVRACNTVRGFSCLGPNQETRPCGNVPQAPLPAVHEDDYEAIDPWAEDRQEALKQLYSDYTPPENRPPGPKPGERIRPKIVGNSINAAAARSAGRTLQRSPGAPNYGPRAPAIQAPPNRHRALSTNGPAHAPSMTPELLFGSKLEIPDTPIKSGSTEENDAEVGSQRSSTSEPVALARHVSSPVPQPQREQKPEKEDQFHKNVKDQNVKKLIPIATDASTPTTAQPTTPAQSSTTQPTTTTSTTSTTSSTSTTTTTSATTTTESTSTTESTTTTVEEDTPVTVEVQQPETSSTSAVSRLPPPRAKHVPTPAAESPDTIFDDLVPNIDDSITLDHTVNAGDTSSTTDAGPRAPKTVGLVTGEEPIDQKLHSGEVVIPKPTEVTKTQEEANNSMETAKALEWLIANMSRAAQEVQKSQKIESSGQTLRLEQSIDEEADVVRTNSVTGERLHSGEIVHHGSHRTHSHEFNPQSRNPSAKQFSSKIYKHPEVIRLDWKRRMPSRDERNDHVGPRIEIMESETTTTASTTTTVQTTPDDQTKIQQELERLRDAMRQMETELASLRTAPQDGSAQPGSRVDPITSHTVSVVTVSPGQPETVISSKALDLELVPRAPPMESGPLPPIIAKNNSPQDLFFIEGLPKTTAAEWSEWRPWAECFCNKQVRTRVCNYDDATRSTGCIGRSFETRQCTTDRFCPSSRKPSRASGRL